MKTSEIAEHLAAAAARFPFLGAFTKHDLLALVYAELGHAEALDDFQPYGGHYAKAIGPNTILHILSGNTPAAGLQSLIRGLLLGAHNLCKIPSKGLSEINAFRRALPKELAARVEVARELPEHWIDEADAVIVFGSDETIAHFREQTPAERIFIGHGHKLSLGFVFEDPDEAMVYGAAWDASVFDQQGCLSPQVFFVAHDSLAFAAQLAAEMERFQTQEPRGMLSVSEANAIRHQRAELNFRASNDELVVVFQSAESTAWTVAFDAAPSFPRSPLNRFIYVKPMPVDLPSALAGVRSHLSCAGIWPAKLEYARRLSALGISRICPIGRMQLPPATWHQDGQSALTPLVHWVDCETAD